MKIKLDPYSYFCPNPVKMRLNGVVLSICLCPGECEAWCGPARPALQLDGDHPHAPVERGEQTTQPRGVAGKRGDWKERSGGHRRRGIVCYNSFRIALLKADIW